MPAIIWPAAGSRQPTAQSSGFELHRPLWLVAILFFWFTCCLRESSAIGAEARCVFVCQPDNDLLEVAQNSGIKVARLDSVEAALEVVGPGDVLLLLADNYPKTSPEVSWQQVHAAAERGSRVFVEYPSFLQLRSELAPKTSSVERAVVTNSFFGDDLPPLSILQVNGLHYLPIASSLPMKFEEPLLTAARVAGFDSAIFGLPTEKFPLLVKATDQEVLVATTGLSNFRRGRYSPQDSWQSLWEGILTWLLRSDREVGLTLLPPIVAPTHARDGKLTEAAQREAVIRGVEWFAKSKMLIAPEWEDRVLQSAEVGRLSKLDAALPLGDGSLGSMEAVLSIIHADGHQAVSTVRRGDCICETAMALAAGAKLLNRPKLAAQAENLIDYYLFTSPACQQERGDPDHSAYGLIAWGISSPDWYRANYGDDNARLMLATLAAAGLLDEDRWNETLARCVLANLRTTGKFGFRGDRIDVAPLGERGWKHYFQAETVSYAPHFEAYLWACYLWAFEQTGDPLLFDRAETAIRMTMRQGPAGWRWTNGLAQERARMLLPLAWLVRVDDTPEHRELLQQAVDGLLSLQDASGAIREELGPPGQGMFPPPDSNETYGVTEASLIARNGDPVADMLYTNNFALLGLHEAAAATGDPRIREAEDRLANFLIRIQAQSQTVAEVDGGWLRAFDFKRWEPWGSNADIGWGAWSIESGWTQGWITFVLAMREMETSLWDMTRDSDFKDAYRHYRPMMIPEESLKRLTRDK